MPKLDPYTPQRPARRTQRRAPMYDLFIAILSIYGLVVMTLLLIVPDSVAHDREVLIVVDTLLCIVFLADFLRSVSVAPSRRAYLIRYGVFDLASAIPFLFFLRVLRVGRLSRLRRSFGPEGMRHIVVEFLDRRAEGVFYITLVLVLLTLNVGSIAVLSFEEFAPGSNIRNANDAVWWSYVTITTVGYGDRYPVTFGGRVVGMIMMSMGIGLFGVMTSYLATLFMRPPTNQERAAVADAGVLSPVLLERLDALQSELAALREQTKSAEATQVAGPEQDADDIG